MKLTTAQVSSARFHRRSGKGSCYKKLLSSHPKSFNGSKREIIRVTSPCNNSDDSGLGIDNSSDYLPNSVIPQSVFRFATSQKRTVDEAYTLSNKRHRTDLKTHNDLEDSYSFPIQPITLSNSNPLCVSPSSLQNAIPMAAKGTRRSVVSGKRLIGPPTLSSQLSSTSRSGKVQLQILNQPEQQHRARYQTEGSRGAVKDRTGNGFPVVKITGYNKLTTLQVFIGSDQGRVTPHMFYQACRVTGKNSTPCSEKNINGTIVIEIDIDPAKDMTVTCDCVGILKERNVDVEHRFPEECSTRSKKKSTRCRMVFRAIITNDDGTSETLQVASQPIACTQPPGIPEICKKSLTSCPVIGGKELFILGKNFLKDTQVMFQTEDWEQSVNPDKEFLQQTHLVCTVPAFKNVEMAEPVNAKICVISGNRTSEPHSFTYTPRNELPSACACACACTNSPAAESSSSSRPTSAEIASNSDVDAGLNIAKETQIKTSSSAIDGCDNLRPVMLWQGSGLNAAASGNCGLMLRNDSKMMPPPVMLPRRSSVPMIVPDGLAAGVKADAASVPSDEMTPLTNATAAAAAAVVAAAAAAVASNPYATTPYSALPDVPIIQDFARNFHSMGQVEHPTLKSEPVLKVEPLSEPSVAVSASSCSASDVYAESTGAVIEMPAPQQQQQQQCRPGMKSVSLCTAQSAAAAGIFMADEDYLYKPATEMYPTVVAKNEPRSSPTEELVSAYDAAAPIIGAAAISNLMLPASHPAHGYLAPASIPDAADMLVDVASSSSPSPPPPPPPSSNSCASASVVLEKQHLTDKMSDLMVGDAAAAATTASFDRKSYEFEKMLSPPSRQQQQLPLPQTLGGCSLKASASYDSVRNAFCYQSVVPQPSVTEANVAAGLYHQQQQQQQQQLHHHLSYMNLEPSADASVSSLLYEKAASSEGGASAAKPLSPLAISMMENTLVSDMLRQQRKPSPPAAANFGGAILPAAYASSAKSFLDPQSQEALALGEYHVPPALVANAASTVPKLEELVNTAADSHIRCGNGVASAAAAAASASASSSSPSSSSSSSSSSSMAGGAVAENPMLAPLAGEPVTPVDVYQSCGGGGGSLVELSVAAAEQMGEMLEMKPSEEEKAMPATAAQTQQLGKKQAEGIFPSEISRMSERDLLNYINPSCFDEVPRWKNI